MYSAKSFPKIHQPVKNQFKFQSLGVTGKVLQQQLIQKGTSGWKFNGIIGPSFLNQ
jgi:hypothetical protein